jgi:hypothetical protein
MIRFNSIWTGTRASLSPSRLEQTRQTLPVTASLSRIIELSGKMGQACQGRMLAGLGAILPEIRESGDWQINRPDVRLNE